MVNLSFFQERVEEIPTLDGYIGLKLSLEKLEWRNKVIQRQKNIENLKKQNKRSKVEIQSQLGLDSKISYQQRGRYGPSPDKRTEVRRKDKIDLNMPITSYGINVSAFSPKDDMGKNVGGQRVKSAGNLKLKTTQGNLFRGPTFDLVYTVPSIASPLPRRGNRTPEDDVLHL